MSSKAVICEFPWQLDFLKGNRDNLIISLTPETSYVLEKSGLPFQESSGICDHATLWKEYPVILDQFFRMTRRLDTILHETDPRFRHSDLKIFDLLGYMLITGHNESLYYTHLIQQLMERGVDTIICADTGEPAVDEYGIYTWDTSIIQNVARAFASRGLAVELQQQPVRAGPAARSTRFSFGQPVHLIKKLGAENLYNAFCNLKSDLININNRNRGIRTVLSVGCKEVDALDPRLLHSTKLVKFQPTIEFTDCKNTWFYTEQFISRVASDPEIHTILTWRGTDFADLLLPPIRFLAARMDFMLELQKKTEYHLNRQNPDLVIFHTMAPFYPPNTLVYAWCRRHHIPFACWMHGGYGAYESLQGYDITDYRLCPEHIVYGNILANLPENPRWIMNRVPITSHQACMHVAGSPYFENVYKSYTRPQNEKKKILFSFGNYNYHNQFYFGHNRPESELSVWRAHERIIRELAKFCNEYDIILKDYPGSPYAGLWRTVLEDCGADTVQYISSERPFHEVLIESDLHIFTWVSTTLFQSMFTDSDICLYDNADLTSEARSLFEGSILFSSDLEGFCDRLSGYLKRGEFYSQNKGPLRSFMIDEQSRAYRHEKFETVVGELIADHPATGK